MVGNCLTMEPLPVNATLLVIDVQQGMDDPRWGRRNNPDAEANIGRLLSAWREYGRPIIHIQHLSTEPDSPLRPERPGVAFKAATAPKNGECVIAKKVNSAFIGTNLERHLRDSDVDTVVVTGLTTNHCVETTTRMAGNLGFKTYLIADATATFDRVGPDGSLHTAEQLHAVTLANVHGEFATVATTEALLQSSDTDSV